MTTKLPSRADHVGSFLRPRSVIEGRTHRAADNISYEQLREIIRTDCTSTLWASSPFCFIRAPVVVVVGDDVVAVVSPPVPDGALTRPVI